MKRIDINECRFVEMIGGEHKLNTMTPNHEEHGEQLEYVDRLNALHKQVKIRITPKCEIAVQRYKKNRFEAIDLGYFLFL